MPIRCCKEPGCSFPARSGMQRCAWHWLARQPIPAQERAAAARRARAELLPGYVYRGRVSRAQWPAGGRWCSGCQLFVPLFACSGSMCRPHASLAARASHVEATYDITAAEEALLTAWQGGRCFICGRAVVRRRLAVDHDHKTDAVRGLLCSDKNFGCNVLLARFLDDPAAAARLVAYAQKAPLARMRAGEPPWRF